IETVRATADAKEIRIQSALDTTVDSTLGDPERLQQVLWNLLSNAIKFTPKGGHVDVTLRRVESNAEIRIADDGIGIQPEFLPYLFNRFRQAESSTTRRHGGLGLGLSIVRSLVEMHGGTVRAESAGAGKGATFIVELPISAIGSVRRDGITRAGEQRSASSDAAMLRGIEILLVEDDADTRELVQRVLEECGAK